MKKVSKKRNDSSSTISDWTTRKLKDEEIAYFNMIHGANACYGCKDLVMEQSILAELDKRGIGVGYMLKFSK